MRKIVLLIAVLFTVWAFVAPDEDSFSKKIKMQLENLVKRYPQEKLYLHTDRNNYEVGDTIWFRAYLTNCYTNKPSDLSRFIYVELRDKQDSLHEKIKIPYRDSIFSGYIPLPKKFKQGDYVLRAYSYWMQNAGDEYLFRKKIQLLNPHSSLVRHAITWEKEGDDYFVNIRFYNSKNEAYDKVLVEYVQGKKSRAKFTTEQGVIQFRLDSANFGQKVVVRFKDGDPFEHEQVLYLPDPRNEFALTYLPEGGNLLEGCNQTVAIKVIGHDGLSREVSGVIMDDLGNQVAHARTVHKGMGAFQLKVDPKRRYHGLFSMNGGEERRFDLPEAVHSGVALKLVTNNDIVGYVVLATQQFPKDKKLYVLVHSKGVPYYCERVDVGAKGKFLKSDLPQGILHVVLLDEEGTVYSERLAFVLKEELGKLELTSNKSKYGVREHVEMKLHLTGKQLEDKRGSFSVAVTDDEQVYMDSLQNNILSSLLLTSDLKGFVEEPAFYFRNRHIVTSRLLDLLLMTQGWNRFNVSNIVKNKYDSLAYFVERGQVIAGSVKNFWGKNAENANLILFSNIGIIRMVKADTQGKFFIDDISYPNETEFYLQGRSKRGGKTIEVVVDEDQFLESTVRIPFDPNITMEEDVFYKHFSKDYYYENGEKVFILDEVIVKNKEKRKSLSHYDAISSYSLDSAQLSKMSGRTMMSILSEFPGILVLGDTITRFGKGILLLIDEFEEPFSRLDMIRPEDILVINLICPPVSTTLWGSSGNNGVLSVTTHPGFIFSEKPRTHVSCFTPLGYQRKAEFYVPCYEVDSIRQALANTRDRRSTIYWNPKLSTDENGKASFSFFTSDSYGPYTVIIEGILNDGTVYRKEEKIMFKL